MNKALLLLLLLLLVAGCGPTITEGVILEKQYIPAHDDVMPEYDPALEIVVLKTYEVPDKWFVTFGDSKVKRTVEVEKSVYDSADVGKAFNLRRTSK